MQASTQSKSYNVTKNVSLICQFLDFVQTFRTAIFLENFFLGLYLVSLIWEQRVFDRELSMIWIRFYDVSKKELFLILAAPKK